MAHIVKTLALAVLVAVALPGCKTVPEADAEAGVSSDAIPFSAAELRTYLADRTQVWDKGGAYYAAGGALQTLWEGERDEGTWSVTGNKLCWHVVAWGETLCETYYHEGNSVTVIYDGDVLPASEIHEGNILKDL